MKNKFLREAVFEFEGLKTRYDFCFETMRRSEHMMLVL